MILPTKHIDTRNSLIGAGAVLLRHLETPRTVTSLWDEVQTTPEVGVYWRFVLALDMLYAMQAVDLNDGLLVRRQS